MFKNMLMAAAGGEGIVEVKTPWDISTMTFVAGGGANLYPGANSVFFKPDASVMYSVHNYLDDRVQQYTMNPSFPYDLSYRTLAQEFLLPTSNQPSDLFFKSDGTVLYVCDGGVLTFSLSTAWNISTASVVSSISPSTAWSFYFRSDGLKLYTVYNNTLKEFNLSTAWSINSASLINSLDLDIGFGAGLFFKPDGSSFYVSDSDRSEIKRYNMPSSWNISTSTFEVTKKVVQGGGIFFSPTGNDLFIANDAVSKYDL